MSHGPEIGKKNRYDSSSWTVLTKNRFSRVFACFEYSVKPRRKELEEYEDSFDAGKKGRELREKTKVFFLSAQHHLLLTCIIIVMGKTRRRRRKRTNIHFSFQVDFCSFEEARDWPRKIEPEKIQLRRKCIHQHRFIWWNQIKMMNSWFVKFELLKMQQQRTSFRPLFISSILILLNLSCSICRSSENNEAAAAAHGEAAAASNRGCFFDERISSLRCHQTDIRTIKSGFNQVRASNYALFVHWDWWQP